MTRLTPDMIQDVPYAMSRRDHQLSKALGRDLRGLAYEAIGLNPSESLLEGLSVACVPITAGKSTISGFSRSVCSVTEHLGAHSHVTGRSDVSGFLDALAAKADMIFMADDSEFVAFNVRAGMAINNIRATALGYFTALRLAAGPLEGEEVLLVGAGRVGSKAADLLATSNAKVTVVDIDPGRVRNLLQTHRSFSSEDVLEDAVKGASLIYNASPARIPGRWIRDGAVVVSPGMPFSFDEEGVSKMRTLVHDPLQIGVAVMAVWSASLSRVRTMGQHDTATTMEVIS